MKFFVRESPKKSHTLTVYNRDKTRQVTLNNHKLETESESIMILILPELNPFAITSNSSETFDEKMKKYDWYRISILSSTDITINTDFAKYKTFEKALNEVTNILNAYVSDDLLYVLSESNEDSSLETENVLVEFQKALKDSGVYIPILHTNHKLILFF